MGKDTAELLARNSTRILDASSIPYRLNFIEPKPMPVVDSINRREGDHSGEPYPALDHERRRVAMDYDPLSDEVRGINHETSELTCFQISWAQRQLMNSKDESVRALIPHEEEHANFGVAYVVWTSDNEIILAQRSQEVFDYKGHWHVSVAGVADSDTAISSHSFYPQFYAELWQELGIEPHQICRLSQLGLCQHLPPNGWNRIIEVCHSASLSKMTAAEVIDRAGTAEDSYEGTISTFTREEVTEMLWDDATIFNPSGAATLIMDLDL